MNKVSNGEMLVLALVVFLISCLPMMLTGAHKPAPRDYSIGGAHIAQPTKPNCQ